jgi:hypothetical protein
MESLTGGSHSEEALARAQMESHVAAGGSLAQMNMGLGQMAGRGLGPLIGGLTAGLGRGKFGAGNADQSFADNFRTGAQQGEDNIVAGMNGISTAELRSRREIREALGSGDFNDDGSYTSRIAMAREAARIANKHGDSKGVARALQAIGELETEEEEFKKLKMVNKGLDEKITRDGIATGWWGSDEDAKSQSGVETVVDGKAGMNIVGPNGELYFQPYNKEFKRIDPRLKMTAQMRNNRDRSIQEKLIKSGNGPTMERAKKLASGSMAALRLSGRVLDNLFDLYDKGGLDVSMTAAGGLSTTVGNWGRSLRGILTTGAASVGNSKENRELKAGLMAEIGRASNRFAAFIKIPQSIAEGSAAHIQHNAAVMEMAYMAARLAEPSNRGLSDKDIEAALVKIAGNTTDPQVMRQRFLEIVLDGSNALEDTMSQMYGQLEDENGQPVTDEIIDRAVLGDSYSRYKDLKRDTFERHSARIDVTGNRVKFKEGSLIGADASEGVAGQKSRPAQQRAPMHTLSSIFEGAPDPTTFGGEQGTGIDGGAAVTTEDEAYAQELLDSL